MYLAIGVEPTKLTVAMPGCSRMASTASLSPCTTFSTPSGRPASLNSSARRIEADGTFSEGFRMNVLPQAIETGNIHSGTMTGKLNGVMPAHTPIGWRTRVAVHVGADVVRMLALQEVRDAACELHHLQAALHRAHGVGQGLAVLLGDEARDVLLVRLQQLQEFLHDPRPAQGRRIAPAGVGRGGRLHGGVDVGRVAERHAPDDRAEGGIGHLPVALARGGLTLAADPEIHARDGAGVFRFVHCMLRSVSACRYS